MKYISLLVAGLLVTVCLHAQPRLPENYYWQKLQNGLEVVVIENSRVPLVTIEIAVKNGSVTEDSSYNGLSHLYEHMFFKSNKTYPTQEQFLGRVKELGISFNGSTTEEFVNYYFTFGSDSLKAGLEFMNTAIRYPIFDTADITMERGIVNHEFERAESDPITPTLTALARNMWGDKYYRKNPIGLHDVINTATPQKMLDIKNKYYHPNNSILIVCGNVSHATVFELTKEIYSSWPSSNTDPHEQYPIPAFNPIAATTHEIIDLPVATTPVIAMGWIGPDTKTDSLSTIVADVFFSVLKLNASKWEQATVSKGLVSFYQFIYYTQQHAGPIMLVAMPDAKKLTESYLEMQAQIGQFGNPDYFTAAQLESAKQFLKRDKIRMQERPSQQSSAVSFYWATSSLEYMTDYFAACDKVTLAQLSAFAKKYISGKPYSSVLTLTAEQRKESKPENFFKN